MLIDLHTHSTASDGSENPSQIIRMAAARQKETGKEALLALTDHDTVAGISEFKKAAVQEHIRAIAGVEISTEYKGEEIHILGYGIDIRNESLLSSLKIYRDDRDSRNERILAKMNELGFEISMDDLHPAKPGASIGRPVMARWLMDHDYVSSVKEAFDRYLGNDKPCYVPRKKPSTAESLSLIHGSGGIAVLAHPVLYKKFSAEEIIVLIESLKELGLDGMEVYYSRNLPENTRYYESLAEKYGLLKTGGSDYHGSIKPDIELFTGTGDLKVPDKIMGPLFDRLGC